MNTAFLMLAHCNADQIAHTIRRLEQGGNRCFVHFDRKSTEDPAPIADRVIRNNIRTYHGGFSLVRATIELLREAVAFRDFDYFYLMSGQCYPVNPIEWLADRLDGESVFMNSRAMPTETWAKRVDRLERRHYETGLRSKLIRRVDRFLPKRNYVKGMGMWPHAGSQWWCIPRDVAKFILDYIDRYPGFSRFMQHTHYSDEVFFQSIVSTMAVEDRMRKALFYARFDPVTGHPVVFDEATQAEIPRDRVFTARKFDSRVNDFFL